VFSPLVLAQSVAFINPGKTDEVYWVTSARAMEAAAKSLGMSIEVHYAQRDHARTTDIARELTSRPVEKRPNYVVFSNDYATGPELLRLFDSAGIKVFMAYSGIPQGTDRESVGRPRERFKGWIGSLEPRAEDAGYLTARALIVEGRKAKAYAADGKLHMLAIAGDRSTPTSIYRNEGMQRAVFEAKDVVLDQEIYAAWNREKAAEQSAWLYERFPQARLIWAGNDLMAFGAMQSWEKRGGKPGKDAWFTGVNTSAEAMENIQNGRLTALAGGHFITGAWAVVMIYDYHHGRDFIDEGLELNRPMFTLFSPDDAQRFIKRFGDLSALTIDFRSYSKVLNPKLKKYQFGFGQLLR
jgi:ABC-type sugar transport system substrate-binding protein